MRISDWSSDVCSSDLGVVLLDGNPDRPIVALREDGDPRVLIEVRRHLGCAFDVETVSAADFDRHLSDRYAMDGTAAAMANSIDLGANELDLIAGDLPSAEDLLDSADDAPAEIGRAHV